MAFGVTCQINTIVNGTAITTTLQTSAAYNGVTFTFDKPMPVGFFVTGKPFVVSDQAFQITAISPGSAQINGAWAHGAMQDPYTTSDQGLDEFMGTGKASYITAANVAYTHSKNVDPGANGNFGIAAGQETSIVKSVRLSAAIDADEWQTIEKYVTLTVLSVAPPTGAYQPTASGLSKVIKTRAHVRETVLRSLAMPGSFPVTPAQAQANVPSDLGHYGDTGESLRRYRLDNVLGTSTSNYSAQITPYYAQFLLALHDSTISASQKQIMIDFVAEMALQIHGLTTRGWGGLAERGNGAGQQGAVQPWIYYGAFLLQDSTMLSAAQAMNTSMNGNAFWVASSDVGIATPGKSGRAAQTFFAEQVGEPWSVPDEDGSNHAARYLFTQMTISMWETVAVMALQNGPGGANGAEAMIGGGAFNSSNPAAASVAMVDRARTWSPDVMNQVYWGDACNDLYDLIRPLTGQTPWSGRPDQLPYGNEFAYDDDIFTPGGAGEIRFDITEFDYATEAVTRRDVRYSLDGIQFVEVQGVAASGSITGLLRGAAHWCGIRQVSASGAGVWSANHPLDTLIASGNDRGKVTTMGSASAAAPANTVAPDIHYRRYPAWGYPYYEPTPATLAGDQVELACGIGYWSGYPTPSFSFQWKRNGANIGGATSATYARRAADASAVLTCEVTAANAPGLVAVTSAGVTVPALNVPPVGTLIDTDFRGAFAVDYEAQIAAITSSNAVANHEPTQTLDGLSGLNFGALRCNKSGPSPQIELPLYRNAAAGMTYRIEAQVATDSPHGTFKFIGTLYLEIRNGSGTTFFTVSLNPVNDSFMEVLTVDDTFTVPGGESDLALFARLRSSNTVNTIGQGDPLVSWLRLSVP